HATALDMRDDRIDGLGAAEEYLAASPELFARCVASFEDIPLADGGFDIALFNASLHYAQNLQQVLGEAARVTRAGGVIVILDSPFYACEAGGEAMVTEKRAEAAARFGSDAPALLSLPCIEYLTPRRLAVASEALRLTWLRQRVSYPLWYEARPFWARLKGRRSPSRFDLWWAPVP